MLSILIHAPTLIQNYEIKQEQLPDWREKSFF